MTVCQLVGSWFVSMPINKLVSCSSGGTIHIFACMSTISFIGVDVHLSKNAHRRWAYKIPNTPTWTSSRIFLAHVLARVRPLNAYITTKLSSLQYHPRYPRSPRPIVSHSGLRTRMHTPSPMASAPSETISPTICSLLYIILNLRSRPARLLVHT